MAGNTETYYKNRKTVTGIDSFDGSSTIKYRELKDKVNGITLIIPDHNADKNKGGLGWAHVRFADPTFTSYTITTTPSNEYSFEIPASLKRIKNLYAMPIISSTASAQCANPFSYFNLQIGETALPRFPRECMELLNTGFEITSEAFTYNSGIKGYTSALASDGTTTATEPRMINLSPMLYENLFTAGNPTKIYIKYAFDTIAKCATSGSSVTVSGMYFIFTEWLETDIEFKYFQSQLINKVRLIPYLYPFRISIGSVTNSTSATTSNTIAQLQGRVPALFVGLYDSGATINQNSHIYSQISTVGLLDVNDQNLIFNWDISESQSAYFAQIHGLSNGLYVNKTHVIPYVFCKDLEETLFNHINTGGLPLKLSQQKIRILPSATATSSYECIVFGFYYSYISLAPDGRIIGTAQIVDG